MDEKKKGLGRLALFPQEETPAEPEEVKEAVEKPETSKPKPRRRSTTRKKPAPVHPIPKIGKRVPNEDRITTTVQFTPETLEKIERLKAAYRGQHKKYWPTWLILGDAVQLLASKHLEEK